MTQNTKSYCGATQSEFQQHWRRTTGDWQFCKAEALFCQKHSQLPSQKKNKIKKKPKSRCSPGPALQICEYASVLVFLFNTRRWIQSRSCCAVPVPGSSARVGSWRCQRSQLLALCTSLSTASKSLFSPTPNAGQRGTSAVVCPSTCSSLFGTPKNSPDLLWKELGSLLSLIKPN